MTEMITLKTVCERVGIIPRDARVLLRKSDIKVDGRRWEFTPGVARKVESLLRKAVEAKVKDSPKKKPPNKKTVESKKRGGKRIVVKKEPVPETASSEPGTADLVAA